MLTETLSGKCPCCGYDKLLQRYGSIGYYQLDGCPNCGFGYGSNHHDNDTFGLEAWLSYGIHVMSCINSSDEQGNEKGKGYDDWLKELNALPELEVRKMVFEWAEKAQRSDDVQATIFEYKPEDVQKYLETNPVIFKQQ